MNYHPHNRTNSTNNLAKDLKRHFTYQESSMITKHMKSCSIYLLIRKIQFETIMTYHFTPTRVEKILTSENMKCWWGWSNWNIYPVVVGVWIGTTALENSVISHNKYLPGFPTWYSRQTPPSVQEEMPSKIPGSAVGNGKTRNNPETPLVQDHQVCDIVVWEKSKQEWKGRPALMINLKRKWSKSQSSEYMKCD